MLFGLPIEMSNRIRVSTIKKFLKMKLSVEDGGGHARLSRVGFSCNDFDRKGNIAMWSLQTQLTAARIFAYHTPDPKTNKAFLQYDKLTSDKLTFMASSYTEVSKAFYDLFNKDSIIPNLCIDVHLGYIGTSSLNSVADMISEENEEKLVHNVNQVVVVDPATRKPTVLPDWWKDEYKSRVVENERLIVKPFEKPTEYHKFDLKVMFSDTDGYKHTNYVSYIRFCFDAAMSAVENGSLSSFKGDILDYRVKSMSMSYRSECKAGDILDIACWENEEQPRTLYFDITKDGKPIFQNTIEFYE